MINSILNQTNILLEYFGGPEEEQEVAPQVPYETIKKLVVYNQFIDLRSRLENIKDPDDDIISIIEFITTTTHFYNQYSLGEVTNLLNNTIDIISSNWNLKVPDLLSEQPEEEQQQEIPQIAPQETQQVPQETQQVRAGA